MVHFVLIVCVHFLLDFLVAVLFSFSKRKICKFGFFHFENLNLFFINLKFLLFLCYMNEINNTSLSNDLLYDMHTLGYHTQKVLTIHQSICFGKKLEIFSEINGKKMLRPHKQKRKLIFLVNYFQILFERYSINSCLWPIQFIVRHINFSFKWK